MANKWRFAVFFVLSLMVISFILSSLMNLSSGDIAGNVMVVSLSGLIVPESPESGLFRSDESISSYIVENLRQASEDPSIKAVLLYINSPGGGAVASYEIADAVKKLDKPTVSVIRSVGASGAYWVASASNKIYSNPLSVVGSLGATSSYLDFSGLLERYNVTYERVVSGKYKDTGTPFRELTDDEREMLYEQINKVHDFFVSDVANNRGLSRERVDELATGRIFLGMEAKDVGLVDELGGIQEAKDYLEDHLNITVSFRHVQRKTSVFDIFDLEQGEFGFNFGRGFASWMTQNQRKEILSLD